MSACNCCDEPPIGSLAFTFGYIVLQCDAIAASLSKCGYPPYSSSGIRYTRVTRVNNCPSPPTIVFSEVVNANSRWLHFEEHFTVCPPATQQSDLISDIDDITCEADDDFSESGSGAGFFYGESFFTTENTTDNLIANTILQFPSYPNTWVSSCTVGSIRSLPSNELSYSIRRHRWRIKHYPTASCYLKVWLQSRFTPEGGGSDTLTPLTAYEWFGASVGNPCLPDPSVGYLHDNNLIYSDPIEVLEPDTNGTLKIEMLKYSCLSDYEPDISDSMNSQPNGFPDPTWTP